MQMNTLIKRVGSGDQEAVQELLQNSEPRLERKRKRIERQVFGELRDDGHHIDEERIRDAAADTVLECVKLAGEGKITKWDEFVASYKDNLRGKLEKLGNEIRSNPFQERKRIPWRKALSIPSKREEQRPSNDPEFIETMDALLGELSPREQDILRRRSAGETIQTVADHYKLSDSRIHQIEGKAIRQLQQQERAEKLMHWLPEKAPHVNIHGSRPHINFLHRKQQEVLVPLKNDFLKHQRAIYDMLKDLDFRVIERETGIKARHLNALCNRYNYDVVVNQDLLDALGDDAIESMITNLQAHDGCKESFDAKAFRDSTNELKTLVQQFFKAGGQAIPSERSRGRF